MGTITAFRHVEKALRSRLGIRAPHARRIIDRRPLNSGLDELAHDVRGCIAIVGDLGGGWRGLNLYHPDLEGTLHWFGSLDLLPEDLVRFDAMPIEQAYAIPDGLFLPETDQRPVGDDAYESGEERFVEAFEWHNGTVLSQMVRNGHLSVVARVDDVESTYAMVPLFGTTIEMSRFVSSRIDVPARLCISRGSQAFEHLGIDQDTPIIDLLVEESDMSYFEKARELPMAA